MAGQRVRVGGEEAEAEMTAKDGMGGTQREATSVAAWDVGQEQMEMLAQPQPLEYAHMQTRRLWC